MSDRELAKILIDKIPESRLLYVLSYLQGAGETFKFCVNSKTDIRYIDGYKERAENLGSALTCIIQGFFVCQ